MLVDAPQHAGLGAALDYTSERPLAPGTLVRVPFGRREVAGIVWDDAAGQPTDPGRRAALGQREALARCRRSAQPGARLVDFAASYYQRSVGEIALSVLPPELRKLDDAQVASAPRQGSQKACRGAAGRPSSPRRRPS